MNVIIVGAGKLGYTLAMHLSSEHNDVTVIDPNPKAIEKVENALDVMPIKGNGFSTSTLLEAGCKTADLLIAVTDRDEINMLCCLTGKKLGAARTIARIRDPKYAKELLLIKEDLGLDMVINPEEAAADEIARILTALPGGAIKIENFAKGRVRMIELIVKENMPLAGMSIKHISDKFHTPLLIGAIIRNGNLIIPNGDDVLEVNDAIYVVGKTASMLSFCKNLDTTSSKVRHVILVGGGKIAYYLAKLLGQMHIKVTIIEKDEQICHSLAETLPQALIIHGDGTDSLLLQSEHFESTDAFVSLTGRDEENIIATLIAKRHNVERVITKISRNHCASLISELGIDTVITPQDIMTNHILKYVRGHAIETLHRMMGTEGEMIEFIASSTDSLLGIPLSKLHLIPDVLITTIVRKNEVLIPTGNDCILEDDRVLIITKQHISKLQDIASTTTGGFTSELKNSLKKFGNAIGM
nr:Trk system potassium transporter TrkA [uncultured Cellulosilyticum sp.]